MGIQDFSSRLRHLRSSFGVGQTEFAQNLGIPRTSLINYEKGISNPSLEFVLLLREKYAVDTDWFLTGEGQPFIRQTLGAGPPGAALGAAPPAQKTTGAAGSNAPALANLGDAPAPALTHTKIPLLKQRVSCGPGANWESDENIEEYLEINTLIPRLGIGQVFALKVQGSSMLGAGIHEGDYVFFDGSDEQRLRDGVYVFTLDGDVYCKRLEFDKLAHSIKVFSVRVADLEKAELVASLNTDDTAFADRFCMFGRVTRCIRLIDV